MKDILEHIKHAPMEDNFLKTMGYWMNRTTQLKVATQHYRRRMNSYVGGCVGAYTFPSKRMKA